MLNICKGLLVSLSQVVKGLMASPTKVNIFKIPSKLSGVVQEDFHRHLEFGRDPEGAPVSLAGTAETLRTFISEQRMNF